MSSPAPAPLPGHYCRAIRVNGVQCRQRAQRGADLCYQHAHHRFPVFPVDGSIQIPLLEDASSIRLVISQVLHGALTHRIGQQEARTAFYGCQVASGLLRIQPAATAKSDQPPLPEEAVADIEQDDSGLPLGPREKYRGPTGEFKPTWSFAKFMYEERCKDYGLPIPACAEEYPPSGWLTEEEMREDPQEWVERTNNHLAALAKAKKQREQQKPAPQRAEDQSTEDQPVEDQPQPAAGDEVQPAPGEEDHPTPAGEAEPGLDLQAAIESRQNGHPQTPAKSVLGAGIAKEHGGPPLKPAIHVPAGAAADQFFSVRQPPPIQAWTPQTPRRPRSYTPRACSLPDNSIPAPDTARPPRSTEALCFQSRSTGL